MLMKKMLMRKRVLKKNLRMIQMNLILQVQKLDQWMKR